ncbi:hypothetical protein Syun_021428 [Stephania yunnanensis]|uniref:Uncharacterized protein n=1 Tax=Stephania yunnanensis TaxID=152371 RepID=A0AAP0IH20_9MAGN
MTTRKSQQGRRRLPHLQPQVTKSLSPPLSLFLSVSKHKTLGRARFVACKRRVLGGSASHAQRRGGGGAGGGSRFSINLRANGRDSDSTPRSTSLLISSSIAIGGFYKKSLNLSEPRLGFLVMFVHFFVGYVFRFGAVLVVFFVTSSALTKYGEEKKRSIDEEFKEGGQRNWRTVQLSCKQAPELIKQ